MKRILICTGVLGGGCVLVFVTAVLASVLAPTGALVPGSFQQLPQGGFLRTQPIMITNAVGPGVVQWQSGPSSNFGTIGGGVVVSIATAPPVPVPATAPAP